MATQFNSFPLDKTMTFTEFFIRRPVIAIVLSLIILLVGLIAYFNLPIRLYPKADTAAVSVSATYAGASAELMESFVLAPIENALSSVDGADYLESASRAGSCSIILHLKLGYDINTALNEASTKIAAIRNKLPSDMNDPTIHKYDPAARPIMYLDFSSSTMASEQVADYLRRVVQPQLQTLSGVASADVWGNEYAMRIWLNPNLMAANNISPSELLTALKSNNLQAPGGQLENTNQILTVTTVSDLNTAKQFDQMVIKSVADHLIRLQDIGNAVFGAKTTERTAYVNGKKSVLVAIKPIPTANTLSVTSEVKTLLTRLKQNLPLGMTGSITWDNSKFIYAAVKEIKITLTEGILCVLLIIFLFIGSWRVLFIPAVTIPLSLIGVCAAMYLMDYSLNTLTFLAMVLSIGVVVDDAIVITENIHRHITHGKSVLDAAILGTKEIQFAIIAITLTLAAVFAPIFFLKGLIGSLFKEFAFVLAGTVLLSGIIALTLSPMLCSKVMTHNILEGKFSKKTHAFSKKLAAKYMHLLSYVLAYKKTVFCILSFIIVGSALCYVFLPSELAPKEDIGTIAVMNTAPTSANLAYTERYSSMLEPLYKKIPEVKNYMTINGDGGMQNFAFTILDLKPWAKRKRTSTEIIHALTPALAENPGLVSHAINPSTLPGAEAWGGSVEVVIQTTGDYLQLDKVLQKIVTIAKTNTGLANIDTSLNIDQPQLNVEIDRDKAGNMGVSIKDIGDAINLAIGQPAISSFNFLGRSYDVIPELTPEFTDSVTAINALQIHTKDGQLVPLSNLVKIKETLQPQRYEHFQQLRSATITASVNSGYSLGEALRYFQELTHKNLPSNMQIDYSGESRLYFQAGNQMLLLFAIATIFIFLILALQFENFRDPLVVLFTIPLSTFGALLTLLLTGGSLNIYSEIGLITLIGLISKHGILIVTFADQLRAQGEKIKDAIIKAAAIRLRPILMTTSAMILGAVPLAFAHGAGAVSRQQIGWVIIGGMFIGTIFTLFVIPFMYVCITRKKVML